MAEIKRKPVKITVDGVEYDAFDEDHTICDVARWLHTMGDSDAAIAILSEPPGEDHPELHR